MIGCQSLIILDVRGFILGLDGLKHGFFAPEGELGPILLRQEGPDRRASIRLQQIQLISVRAVEVRSGHVVLVAVVKVEDPLVLLIKIFTIVQRIDILRRVRVQWNP